MNANLYALLESRFPGDPDAPCLILTDCSAVTYGALKDGTARISALLLSLGAKPGSRVAVQVEKSPANVMLYLACLKAGLVYLPLNTAYTGEELSYFLSDSEPHVLVCRAADQAALAPIASNARVAHVLGLDDQGGGELMERAAACAPHLETAEAGPDDLAAILYTSGTTGRSKGAMLSHGNLSSNALSLHQIWGFKPGDVLLHALPIFHVHGLFVALNCALLNGSAMHFLSRFDVDQVFAALPHCTVMMGVPTFYVRMLADARLTKEASAHMRLFISGSAPLLSETFLDFENRTGQRILERYGMTEAGMITSNPLDGSRIPGTVGYPLPGVEVRTDKQSGVMEIRGPNVFKGYWRMPDKTAEEFKPGGWFITGDLADIADDGRVTISGRAKDLIISGGLNVYPKEIEEASDALPGVQETAVIGLPHPDFGEAVVAVAVPSSPDSTDEAAVRAALKERLAAFKVPKRVIFVDALPRNTMGKVQKAELRKRYADLFKS